MKNECKRCLLLEASGKVTYDEIMAQLEKFDQSELVDYAVFEKRISYCKLCDHLISGMCRKCGCYVEIRARLKNASCPDFDNRQW